MSLLSSNISALAHGAPRLEPSTSGVGPGPLSPAWPRPAPVEPPANEWDALGQELSALRRACWYSLRDDTPGGQLLLGLDERDDLNAKLRRLKAVSLSELSAYHRSSIVDAWPDPVLPNTVLWGARDLAAVLGHAIGVAATLSYRIGNRSHP